MLVRLGQEVQELPRALSRSIETVEGLLAALRERDEEGVAANLHPAVEAFGARGRKRGIPEVVAWAKPSADGHLVSSVEVDELREVGGWVAVGARRIWTWAETGEVADDEPFGVLFGLRDGRVVHWNQTYASLADAIEAIPAD